MQEPKMMHLTINGEVKRLNQGMNVTMMLSAMELSSKKVAVERNRIIVPRSEHGTTTLMEGDILEIVHFIGGG